MSKNCVIRADSVHLTDGVYSIVVPDGSFDGLCQCGEVLIGLYTSIPTGSECNVVKVTDGTTTLTYVVVRECCGCPSVELWRTTLKCRTILVARYSDVGTHGLLTINAVKGRRGCV